MRRESDFDPIRPGDLYFFYGSLCRGLDLHRELGLEGRAEPVGEGTCPGRLHDLGECPGLVEDPACRVHGEVFRIHDLDLARAIDAIEVESGYVSLTHTLHC